MPEISVTNDELIVLSGKVSMAEVVKTRKKLERQIRASKSANVSLNLKGLQTFNSAVVSMLLCLLREAKQSNRTLEFIDSPQGLLDMARVGGLESILIQNA